MADLGDLSGFELVPDMLSTDYGPGNQLDWNHRLAGTISLDAVGGPMRVAVYSRLGAYIGSAIANKDGTWEIIGLPSAQVTGKDVVVVGYDDSGAEANAVIKDFVTTVA